MKKMINLGDHSRTVLVVRAWVLLTEANLHAQSSSAEQVFDYAKCSDD